MTDETRTVGPAQELRDAALIVEVSTAELMDSRLAPHIMRWLRGEARALEQIARSFADPTNPRVAQHLETFARDALAFARAVRKTA